MVTEAEVDSLHSKIVQAQKDMTEVLEVVSEIKQITHADNTKSAPRNKRKFRNFGDTPRTNIYNDCITRLAEIKASL